MLPQPLMERDCPLVAGGESSLTLFPTKSSESCPYTSGGKCVYGVLYRFWIMLFEQKEHQMLMHILNMGTFEVCKCDGNTGLKMTGLIMKLPCKGHNMSPLLPQLPMPGSPILADVSTQKGPRCKVFESTDRLFQGTAWKISIVVACAARSPWQLSVRGLVQPIALGLNLPSLFSRITPFMTCCGLSGSENGPWEPS